MRARIIFIARSNLSRFHARPDDAITVHIVSAIKGILHAQALAVHKSISALVREWNNERLACPLASAWLEQSSRASEDAYPSIAIPAVTPATLRMTTAGATADRSVYGLTFMRCSKC